MKNIHELQKEKMKEKMSKLIDEHYEKFSECSIRQDFTIDQMEELMIEQQKKIREALKESNSELASSIETEVKKNARSAVAICVEPKKAKR